MSEKFRLPPSARDFDVFFKVRFHSVSTWQTAELHNISQTRVRQLVTLVGDWVAENLPEWGEADLAKQVRLAQHIAANKLEHQYEVAMNHWNAEGDPKHLRQATRIALAQARLGVVPGRVHALAADVTEGPLELGDEILECGADIPVCRESGESRVHEQMHQSRGTVHCAPLMHPTEATQTRQDPQGGGFPGGSLGTSADTADRNVCPTVGDCSLDANNAARGEEGRSEEIAASDCPEMLIERERRQRLIMVRGMSRMEERLLTLLENQGSANPEKVAELQETLSRVRQEKATAELRLSRFMPGVHIQPLEVQQQSRTEQCSVLQPGLATGAALR